jgi:16S rRNA (guanine527-N7)-methyltransferase
MRMANTTEDSVERRLAGGLEDLELACAEETRARLLGFLVLLDKWNRSYNLTAIDDPLEMVSRHLLDSLSIAVQLCGNRVLDVGSGAGLPGIPLAIWYPEREFHLLDSNGKKIRFLFQAKLALSLANVTLHHERTEAMRDEQGFDCITSRAFASLGTMIRASGHLMAPRGCMLAMKGAVSDEELAEVQAPYTIASRTRLTVPGITGERQLLKITRQGTAAQ